MLTLSGVNVLAVVAVWFLYVMVGAFWYSPYGFSKQWAKLSGVDLMKLPKKAATNALIAVVLSSAIQAVVLAAIINSLHVINLLDGFITGLVLWLGLTAATTVGVSLYQRRGWKFIWLNSSYFLLVMVVGSGMLAVW